MHSAPAFSLPTAFPSERVEKTSWFRAENPLQVASCMEGQLPYICLVLGYFHLPLGLATVRGQILDGAWISSSTAVPGLDLCLSE